MQPEGSSRSRDSSLACFTCARTHTARGTTGASSSSAPAPLAAQGGVILRSPLRRRPRSSQRRGWLKIDVAEELAQANAEDGQARATSAPVAGSLVDTSSEDSDTMPGDWGGQRPVTPSLQSAEEVAGAAPASSSMIVPPQVIAEATVQEPTETSTVVKPKGRPPAKPSQSPSIAGKPRQVR